ncbi:MAG: diacylglycerol kinase family protein [Chloroflexia bacterium]
MQTRNAELETRQTTATRAWLIENPVAGQGDWAEQIAAAQATLRAAGWEVALHRTAKQGDATALARAAVEDGADVVIVAGGDGTVNEALQGLAGQRRTALAVLPGGTVNVWATELGADQHEVDIARRIATGRRHAVDLGKVNDRYFLMMASVGFDAEANATVVESGSLKRLKRRVGPAAYALGALLTLGRFRSRRVALSIDGAPVNRHLLMLILGNTRLYGGIAEITYRARADDGLLDVCVLAGRGPLDLVRRGWSVLRRQHAADPAIDYRRARRVVLDPPEPLRIQADGEDIGTTPATFTVVPNALEVIVLSETPPGFLGDAEQKGEG